MICRVLAVLGEVSSKSWQHRVSLLRHIMSSNFVNVLLVWMQMMRRYGNWWLKIISWKKQERVKFVWWMKSAPCSYHVGTWSHAVSALSHSKIALYVIHLSQKTWKQFSVRIVEFYDAAHSCRQLLLICFDTFWYLFRYGVQTRHIQFFLRSIELLNGHWMVNVS